MDQSRDQFKTSAWARPLFPHEPSGVSSDGRVNNMNFSISAPMPPLELLVDVLLVSDWVLSSLFDAISALALASILSFENHMKM
jgi:hypothetical protein